MKLHFSGPSLSSPTSTPSIAAIVAARMGVNEWAAQTALDGAPLTPGDHIVHGLAALEEYRRGGPKASAHLAYAHRRIHAAAEILSGASAPRRRLRDRREWLNMALRDLLACEGEATRAARSMHTAANDNA